LFCIQEFEIYFYEDNLFSLDIDASCDFFADVKPDMAHKILDDPNDEIVVIFCFAS
jgi:hypothetical protein